MILLRTTAPRRHACAQTARGLMACRRIFRSIRTSWLQPALLALFVFELSGCTHAPRAADDSERPLTQAEKQYARQGRAQWTYPEGPGWGAECAAASPPQQSPIDLSRVTTTPWNASTVVTQATFDAADQNIVFMPSPGPGVAIKPGVGATGGALFYSVAGFHFHNGSEHLVSGNPVLEMHIKATDQFGDTAVFGVLWSVDSSASPDLTLQAAHRSISAPPGSLAAVDVSRLLWLFGQQPFYSYVGSLTTPPCSPGIRWYVLQTPIRTTRTAVDQLTAALVAQGMPPNNVRQRRAVSSPQPLVHLVTPK